MGRSIRVLVVDDSPTMRAVIADAIAAADGLEVVGMAADGREALDKTLELEPDLVTLDVRMPRMDGLAVLEALLERRPTPVIMVSALTRRDADVTWQALDRGALDYVAKPESAADAAFAQELLYKIRAMAGADVKRVLRIRQARRAARAADPSPPAGRPAAPPAAPAEWTPIGGCVAIGISTGGPPALSLLFQSLAPPMPPIVIVQHMPPRFTGPFADRLNSISRLSIREAGDGDRLRPNEALIAPGGRHLRLEPRGEGVVVKLFDDEPYSGHKPSVDLMMNSAAAAFGANVIGVIMTGMGHDGVEGCGRIRAAGGYVLGQDEATSDVYGMNKAAFSAGHVDRQFALENLPGLLREACARKLRGPSRPATPSPAFSGAR